jgi:hypothetical protein
MRGELGEDTQVLPVEKMSMVASGLEVLDVPLSCPTDDGVGLTRRPAYQYEALIPPAFRANPSLQKLVVCGVAQSEIQSLVRRLTPKFAETVLFEE